ncbi:MAG: hypothetical protein KAG62_14770 [Caulobacter sp.]|jgi:hypothetical protein|uniref:hypothetical protein n=1 Tax=Caulobacter sp. CCH9-E1 TaxID=1768768 RepID=UPI00082B74F0|nr:hypothetical protein [Caulobacter sp. CCH9-E1]MCK5911205.1 hypothetical protein [Caulobacter sp.]
MSKTHADAVEWLIETVKEALENGTATEDDLQEWLLAAVLLEEMAVEEEADARSLDAWIDASPTLH